MFLKPLETFIKIPCSKNLLNLRIKTLTNNDGENLCKISNIIDIVDKMEYEVDKNDLKKMVMTAFGYGNYNNVDIVYPKTNPTEDDIDMLFDRWIVMKPALEKISSKEINLNEIEDNDDDDELEEGEQGDNVIEEKTQYNRKKYIKKYTNKEGEIIDMLNDTSYSRDTKLQELTKTLDKVFPKLQGDNVTFIGSTFLKYGDEKPYLNHCIVLKECDDMENVENGVIQCCSSEKKLLLAWKKIIQDEDPDIIIGYNIFGFDYNFLYERAKEVDCVNKFLQMSRNRNEICIKKDWKTGKESIEESSIIIASGQHELKFIKMNGRLQIDLYNYLRRDYQLTSYKLDYVSGYFIGDTVKQLEYIDGTTKIYSKNLTGLEVGCYVNFEETAHSVDYYKKGKKFKVIEIIDNTFVIDSHEEPDMNKQVKWGLAKDDVTPQDIFRMTNEGPDQKAIIAKYCIQDCNLVHHLMRKIDVVTGYTEMSKLCSVPMNFLVMRGQGIKLTSYISKKCREKKTLMPVIEKKLDDSGYEGAEVLTPKCNLYLDNPVACVDYSSLYPSAEISDNLSHDSKVWTKEYDLNDNLLHETGEKNKEDIYIYDNLPDYKYVNVKYDTYQWIRKTPKAAATKQLVGYKICRFAQYPEGRAIMPSILEELLAARKATRKMIPDEKDDFMKNVLDKRQLSIKVTANSLYGQTGAKTSTFYEKDVAASTTAIGRKLLNYGKDVIEQVYGDRIVNTKDYGEVRTNAEYIYGDTDSVFFTFNLKNLDGTRIIGKQALEITIELAQEAGKLATAFLKYPHDLEYEKTFLPFVLLSKKRYVGMLYELDSNKCYRKSMGIVLKRRDNAPIVKDIYGGVIDILMKEKDVQMAIQFVRKCLQDIIDEKYPMDKLIITKSLRSNYKNPQSIAHKVLADRMGKRDPGNKPGSGDRIPFVYIKTDNKKALQGERVEHPDYIKENNIPIDYGFYITNQIMKPLVQVFTLVLDQIPEFKKRKEALYDKLETLKETLDEEKYAKKETQLKEKEVKAIIFDYYLDLLKK